MDLYNLRKKQLIRLVVAIAGAVLILLALISVGESLAQKFPYQPWVLIPNGLGVLFALSFALSYDRMECALGWFPFEGSPAGWIIAMDPDRKTAIVDVSEWSVDDPVHVGFISREGNAMVHAKPLPSARFAVRAERARRKVFVVKSGSLACKQIRLMSWTSPKVARAMGLALY